MFVCLNPYYTGIHLHRRITSPDALSLVLILIILEYIYINYNVTLAASVSVLILIILEYIYMMLLEQSLRRKCLNPYYTGIHLHFIRFNHRFLAQRVLILIILEYIYIKNRHWFGLIILVLILIILEYIYIW